MAGARRVVQFLALMAAVGALCAGVWARLPRERSLLERAINVSGSNGAENFYWFNNREILSVYNSGYDHYHVNRYDVAAKTKTNLPAVEKAMHFLMQGAIYPSGDGRQFLCPGWDDGGDGNAHIVSLDTATVTAATSSAEPLVWNPGAASWLYFSEQGAALVNPLNPRLRRVLPIKPPDFDDPQPDFMMITPDNRLLEAGGVMDSDSGAVKITLAEWRVETNRVVPVRQYEFSAAPEKPTGREEPTYCAINPQGSRVFWSQCSAPSESFFHRQMRRLFPGRFAPPKNRLEIWSANLDGTDRRNFGFIEMGDENFLPMRIRFSPDGTQIGFVYGGAIYALTAQ